MAVPTAVARHWPLVAGLVSAAMLATAHGFERLGGYVPCALCYRQREVYWGALVVVIGGLVLVRLGRLPRRVLLVLIGAVFLTSLVMAGYHAGVEWKWWPGPTTCSGPLGAGVSLDDLSSLLDGGRIRPPACDEAAWRMFGLSMAGWNALVSLALATVSFAVAFSGAGEKERS